MADDAQQRTHQPTAKRRRDAKKQGTVPRSKELNTAMLLISASLVFLLDGKRILAELSHILISTLYIDNAAQFTPHDLMCHLKQASIAMLITLAPFFLALFVTAMISPLLLGGVNLNFGLLRPQSKRLSLTQGFKKMFSANSAIELIKAICKFSLILGTAILFLYANYHNILHLDDIAVMLAIKTGTWKIALGFSFLAMSLVLIAGVDVPYQLWQYHQQLLMTRQEIKEETKSTEGPPEVKARIKRRQTQIARRYQGQTAKNQKNNNAQPIDIEFKMADVLLTDNTQYAVAIKYQQDLSDAPIVVSKGMHTIAHSMISLATSSEVPVIQSPELVRSLFYHSDIGYEVPGGLYLAVAKMLAYLQQLKRYQAGLAAEPVLPLDINIPPHLHHD